MIRNFCQSRKCQNLALVNRRLRKLAKKGDFRNILDQYLGFTLKRVLKISDPCILWKHFGTKLMIDCKKETIFSWLFIRYYFQLKKDMFLGSPVPFFLDSSLDIPYKVLRLNVCNKEHLALRNNFRVTKKFLITKFDCI